MKNYSILFMAAMACMLAGCAGKQLLEEDRQEITIEAVMAENNPTKTIIQDDGTAVLWEASDEIKVFYDGTGSRFANQYTEPSGTAKFSGVLNVVFGSNEGFSAETPLWGLYPYRADATATNTSVTTTLPAAQIGRAGSFAKGTNITLGKSSSLSMGFYNVCGGVRFSLTQEGVKEVVFQGQNDEDLAGKVKLAFVDGVPAVQEVTEGQKTITLTAPNNGTFETGEWYYIVALPGTLSNGFKMTFKTDTQYATLKSSGAKTIKRGIFGSLADADEDLIYKDKEVEEPQTGNIVFADPAAKYACVAKYDTDGDGEVSVEEAEAATSFDGLFTNWKGVAHFDEISFFKNVQSLSGVFNGCNKLVSLTVPENITDLGTYAFSGCSLLESVELPSGITAIGDYTFQNCSSLESINLPQNVTTIGQYAFNGCYSLGSIEIPSGVTSIANYCFQNCASLASVGIPSGVTSIGLYAFRGCSSLSAVDLPANLITIGQYAFSGCSTLSQMIVPNSVTSLGNYVFSGCSKLETVTLPSGISSIPQYCFQNCSALNSVTIPEGITSVASEAFFGTRMWKLELPSSITSLGSSCFYSVICVLLPATVPIQIEPYTFNGVGGIFVPAELLDVYSVMTNWTNYPSKMHAISSYKDRSDYSLATEGSVDMGTSVKWATCNVGASKPEDYGDYYAWGETTTYYKEGYAQSSSPVWKSGKYYGYDWESYFDNPSNDGKTFVKYNYSNGKRILDMEDDVAHVSLGGNYRMPTNAEVQELSELCLQEWINYNGVNGEMFYNVETSQKIFFSAAGYRYRTSLNHIGTHAVYWTSDLYSIRDNNGDEYGWTPTNSWPDSRRHFGYPVRPVCE